MVCKLIPASAGAGKSYRIVTEALEKSANGQIILILTYTENNQRELLHTICRLNGHKPSNIIVKGWFTFLLEDMIRPYQRCIFTERIPAIFFNSSDPHKRNGRTIKGRSEKLNGSYNLTYYLTKSLQRVHTHYLAKLATKVHQETKGKTSKRLTDIYDSVYIDEVQDLIGWDFDVVHALVKTKKSSIICVGDFRQTIYATSNAQKKPKTNSEKLQAFENMGFEQEPMNVSRRCIQPICDISDLVHADEGCYATTHSQVAEIPGEYMEHCGVYVVSSDIVSNYLQKYKPVILRRNKTTETQLCEGYKTVNFGESKGLGFERVLILPTDKQRKFLAGDTTIFSKDKTEKSKNTLYVAITRARYSIAFVYNDDKILDGIHQWQG